jgi:transposase
VKWIEKWFSRTGLGCLLKLENLTYKQLLSSLDSTEERSATIQRRLYDAAVEKLKLSPSSMVYDVTNVYFYGCSCPMAKYGYNKDKMRRPQVQIGLAITKEEKIPIFHKVFDGDIHDAKTIMDIMNTLRQVDVKDVTFVWDRGVTSKLNINDAKNMGCSVICGVPLKGDVKEDIRSILDEDDITAVGSRIELRSSVLYASQKRYRYQGISGYLTVCLDKKAKLSREEERRSMITQAASARANGKALPEDLKQYFKYKNIDEEALKEAEVFDGVSAVFSTKKIPSHEMLRAYFEKDVVEKAFRSMKSTMEIRPIRHWLSNRVRAHILICYIAYYLLSIIEFRLKNMDITAEEALDTLSTVYRVHIRDPKTKNTFSKIVTLSSDQERILKLINRKILKRNG